MNSQIDQSSPVSFLKTMRLSHYEVPQDFMIDMKKNVNDLNEELIHAKKIMKVSRVLIDEMRGGLADCDDRCGYASHSGNCKAISKIDAKARDFLNETKWIDDDL